MNANHDPQLKGNPNREPRLQRPGHKYGQHKRCFAIAYMNRLNALSPDQPFFIKYAPGGVHAPHHATPEWIEKISKLKLFDQGWNKLENQKKLGVIPANAKLTPWPKDLLKEWDQLSDDEKKMFVRQVDVFAAYVAYTDHEIGRVIQSVEDMGKRCGFISKPAILATSTRAAASSSSARSRNRCALSAISSK
jgi:arylsulfatase A-like enzyme